MSKLVIQPSFKALGQTHAKRQTFEKTENELIFISYKMLYLRTRGMKVIEH